MSDHSLSNPGLPGLPGPRRRRSGCGFTASLAAAALPLLAVLTFLIIILGAPR